MNSVYRAKEFIAFKVDDLYLVQNIKKTYEDSHVFFKNENAVKTAIELAIKKELPHNIHMIDKLLRLSNDDEYKLNLNILKNNRLSKKEIEYMMKEKYGIDVDKCV